MQEMKLAQLFNNKISSLIISIYLYDIIFIIFKVDKTNKEMTRLNSKLKNVIQKTSTCGLMVFIGVEVMILILLLVLF